MIWSTETLISPSYNEEVLFDNEDCFSNINTPEDLIHYEKIKVNRQTTHLSLEELINCVELSENQYVRQVALEAIAAKKNKGGKGADNEKEEKMVISIRYGKL